MEKDIDESAIASPKFYTIGVLLIPLSTNTSLSQNQAIKVTKSKDCVDIEMGNSQRAIKHPGGNETLKGVDHERTKPGLHPFLNFSMNPFRIVSNSFVPNTPIRRVVTSPDDVPQPTLSATSLSLASTSSASEPRNVVNQNDYPHRRMEATPDETASDRSTIGLLPPNPHRPSEGDVDNDDEEITLVEDLTASTTMCSSLYSLRLPLSKLLPSESLFPVASSSSPPGLILRQNRKGEQKSSSEAESQQHSKPALLDVKVTPTELMIIDVTGQVSISKINCTHLTHECCKYLGFSFKRNFWFGFSRFTCSDHISS